MESLESIEIILMKHSSILIIYFFSFRMEE